MSVEVNTGLTSHHYYPYENGYKVRKLPKEFIWVGKAGGVFGKDKFAAKGQRLVVCEGEIDTLSVAQMWYDKYKTIFPVIGLSSSGAVKELLLIRDWIREFDEVVIVFDEDDAGKKAAQEAVKIIGFDKVRIAKLPLNDANEVLVKKGWGELLRCVYNAEKYRPKGFLNKEEIWESLELYNKTVSVPYPDCLSGLNEKIKGLRFGEIVLLISGTGSGKSSVMREIIYHIIQTTEDKVGIVALEESVAETARKLSSMVLNRNSSKEMIPLEELKVGFDQVFADDRIVLLDHQGSMGESDIISQLEYMALSGCKYLFIDHVTILVSEFESNLSGNEAIDRVMNELLKLVKRYPINICLISHLRKVPSASKSFESGKLPDLDDIKGSGSIKQIAMDVIAFSRNMSEENEEIRNRVQVAVLKSRFTGLTGPVRGFYYDYNTGRIFKQEDDESF
jgi:twinkle protein